MLSSDDDRAVFLFASYDVSERNILLRADCVTNLLLISRFYVGNFYYLPEFAFPSNSASFLAFFFLIC